MIVNKASCRIWFIFISILILLNTSCSVDDSENGITSTPVPIHLQDQSWLIGDPCDPPCWYGLYVDQSTEQDVLEVLDTLSFIESDKITFSEVGFNNYLTGEYFTANKIQAPIIGNRSISLKIANGLLVSVGFSLNYNITLGEVVKIIGAPDVVNLYSDINTGFCDIELFWLEKQLILSTRITGNDWENRCAATTQGIPLDNTLLVDYVYIIYQDWLTAFMKDDRGYPWPGLSD